MKKLLLSLSFCLLLARAVCAQDKTQEVAEIKRTINTMFEGMRKGDSTLLASAFAPNMILQTIITQGDKTEVRTEPAGDFLKAVGSPHEKAWDEQVTFSEILVDANLASVWTPYKFFLGKDFSHCGVNSFQLVKINGNWKIVHIIDTRRKDNCN